MQGQTHYLTEGPEAFEDGTLNYLTIPAVSIGLEHLNTIGMSQLQSHVTQLGEWLLAELVRLEHANGAPLIKLYGPVTMARRGATFSMNFCDAAGNLIDHHLVEQEAAAAKISLRTGCFCNPGTGESAFGITRDELIGCFSSSSERLTIDDLKPCIGDKSSGAVRVSLGVASNFRDVFKFVEFSKRFLD